MTGCAASDGPTSEGSDVQSHRPAHRAFRGVGPSAGGTPSLFQTFECRLRRFDLRNSKPVVPRVPAADCDQAFELGVEEDVELAERQFRVVHRDHISHCRTGDPQRWHVLGAWLPSQPSWRQSGRLQLYDVM